MPNIDEALKEAWNYGKDKGVEPIDLRLMVMKDENLPEQIDVLINKDKEMKNYSLFKKQYHQLIDDDMPVEYILNEADFLGHLLSVNENV